MNILPEALVARLRAYWKHLVAALAVLLGTATTAAVVPRYMAGGSPSFLGCTQLGTNSRECISQTTYIAVPADAATNVWQLWNPANGSPYAGMVVNENVDIASKILLVANGGDGGSLSTARIRLFMAGTLNQLSDGGIQFQDPTGGVLAQVISSQIGTYIAGATANVVTCQADSGAGTICIQVLCPGVCNATIGNDFTDDLPIGIADAGPDTFEAGDAGDAADAADSADAFDAGSPPTISLLTPNDGTAAGGNTITITGTNFTAGTTFTVNGVAMTSVNCAGAPTSCTAVTPAYGGAGATTNGSGATGIVVTATTGALSGSGSGSPLSASQFSYLASTTTAPQWRTRGDVGVTGSAPVTAWADITAGAHNWTNCAAGSTLTANWNSSGFTALTTNGTNQCMTAANTMGAAYTLFLTAQFLSTAGSPVEFQAGGAAGYLQASTNFQWTTTLNSGVASDTLSHVFVIYITGAAGSYIQVDTTAGTTGSLAGGQTAEAFGDFVSNFWANANIGEVLSYNANLTGTEITNNVAALKRIWKTN